VFRVLRTQMHAMADLVAMAFDRLRIDNPSPALFFMENRSAVVFHCRYSITSYASSDSKPTKARGKYLGQCRRAALCNRCAERGRGVQTKASNPHSTLVKWNESSDVRAAASPPAPPRNPPLQRAPARIQSPPRVCALQLGLPTRTWSHMSCE
jgi:hypothetical protein